MIWLSHSIEVLSPRRSARQMGKRRKSGTIWGKAKSRSTDMVYYHNKQTRQSIYTEKGLVDWWGFEREGGTGAKTYVHVLTGERSAERPAASRA